MANNIEKQIEGELRKSRTKQLKNEAKVIMQKIVDAEKVVDNLKAELNLLWADNKDLINEIVVEDDKDKDEE